VQNAFVILRMVATARYLHLKSQELHEALMEAHGTLGEDADERVRLREEDSAIEANARRVLDLTDELAALANQHQEAQAAAAFNAERARLAEWDADQLRGQIGLDQQDLARARNDLTAAVAQAHTQVADLDDRLKASVAAATSLAELSARLQQQQDSSRANDERISQSLRQRQWTEAQIATLLSPSQPSSSMGATHHHRSRALRHPCLREWAVSAPCTPHLVTGLLLILQPRTKGRLEGPSRRLSPAMVCAPSRTTRRSPWSIPPATRSLPLPPTSSTLRPCVLRVLVL
jgi:hypothetical protein